MKSISRLFKFLSPFWRWVGLSLLLSSATIAANIGLLGTSAYLIARAALHPSISVLQVAIVGVRFFGIMRAVFRYMERLTSHSVNLRLVSNLRSWFYRAMEPLAPAGFSAHRIGDLLSRSISDINSLDTFFIRVISPPLTALFLATGIFLFIGWRFPPVLPIVIFGYITGSIVLPFFQWLLLKTPSKELVEDKAVLEVEVVEGLSGISEIIINGRAQLWLENFRGIQQRIDRSQNRTAWVNGLGAGSFILLTNLTMLVSLGFFIPVAHNLDEGGVWLCVLALFILASFEAVSPMNLAAQNLVSTQAAESRLNKVATQIPDVKDLAAIAESPNHFSLTIKSLSFSYPLNPKLILNDISIEIPENQRIALLGPSGSGKTSLIHLLARFWDYEVGSILLGGIEIKSLSADYIRSQIKILPQTPYIFTGTIQQNLILANPTAKDDQIEMVLEQTDLLKWIRTLRNGLQTWVGESGVQLSGGERQRLAIARLLLQKPQIMILDEPFQNLDIDNAEQLARSLLSLKTCSQMWVSHRTLGLDHMDRIYVINDGCIVENGSPKQLHLTQSWYARMVELERCILSETGTK